MVRRASARQKQRANPAAASDAAPYSPQQRRRIATAAGRAAGAPAARAPPPATGGRRRRRARAGGVTRRRGRGALRLTRIVNQKPSSIHHTTRFRYYSAPVSACGCSIVPIMASKIAKLIPLLDRVVRPLGGAALPRRLTRRPCSCSSLRRWRRRPRRSAACCSRSLQPRRCALAATACRLLLAEQRARVQCASWRQRAAPLRGGCWLEAACESLQSARRLLPPLSSALLFAARIRRAP